VLPELVAQAAVEAFDKGVLNRLLQCNVVPADLGLVSSEWALLVSSVASADLPGFERERGRFAGLFLINARLKMMCR